MTPLSDFLSGPIAREYTAIMAANDTPQQDTPTETCGSDCTSGGECQDSTCSQQQPQINADAQGVPKGKRIGAFLPVVSGWNDPPAMLR